MWFDLLLPGLGAEDVPIPLGGTSNHFRIDGLLEAGAWDPFNVTEDADLGVRLHKRGLKTDILESTTFEEATSTPINWIRQRSRWVKGYIQTWLVQMRRPWHLMREIGPKSWFSFQLTVGGTPAVFLLNPIYWLLTTAWLLTEANVIESAFPASSTTPVASASSSATSCSPICSPPAPAAAATTTSSSTRCSCRSTGC